MTSKEFDQYVQDIKNTCRYNTRDFWALCIQEAVEKHGKCREAIAEAYENYEEAFAFCNYNYGDSF